MLLDYAMNNSTQYDADARTLADSMAEIALTALKAPADLEALLDACATHARLLNEVALRE